MEYADDNDRLRNRLRGMNLGELHSILDSDNPAGRLGMSDYWERESVMRSVASVIREKNAKNNFRR